ncbi:MAG: hypothetical protein K6U10_13160 [Acidobacteriia bacterium]|nr:hypothetical protein [Methyloceanibacter sp.]MCL6492751.1 hypothetical protein [Terriglobia bacterium]
MPGKADDHAFDSLLQDPLIRLLMQSDRVSEAELRQLLRHTRAALAARHAPREAEILSFPSKRKPSEMTADKPASFVD